MVEDKRTFERFQARFPAKFKDTRENFGDNVYLRDASASGAKLSTKERMYLHDHVDLEVELSDGARPMNLRGEVVWVKGQEYNIWDIGFRFHEVDFMRLSRLYNLVSPS